MAVSINKISKSFGDPPKTVLSDISLTFTTGITCLMGPSGIGKTTLAYIIAGLVAPDSGNVSGVDTKQISFVFQEDRLLELETALRNVLFVVKKTKENVRTAQELLIRAGLEDSINKRCEQLSGGMKRRVCICRALMANHSLLIMDEPFKGLDSGIKPSIMDMVKQSAAENKTVICITHDEHEADYLGGNTVYL